MWRGVARDDRDRRLLPGLCLTEIVSWGALYYSFGVFVVPMREEFGWSTAEASAGFSIALAVSAFAGIGMGRWVDARGGRGLMTVGSALSALLLVTWSQVSALWAFYLVWALIGLAMAAVLYEPAFAVLAKRVGGQRLARTLSVLTLAGSLGSFIFLPLSARLIDDYGWRHALVVLAAIVAVTTVPIHATVLGAPQQTRSEPSNEHSGRVRASAHLRLLTCAVALGAGASSALAVHLVPLLIEFGHTPGFAAFVGGITGIALIPGRILFLLLPALPRGALAAGSLGLMCGGSLLLLGGPSPSAAVVFAVAFGLGNGLKTLILATAIRDCYGGAVYGSVGGLSAAAVKAAQAIAPLLAGLVYDVGGTYEPVLLLLIATTALATVAAGRARPGGAATVGAGRGW